MIYLICKNTRVIRISHTEYRVENVITRTGEWKIL